MLAYFKAELNLHQATRGYFQKKGLRECRVAWGVEVTFSSCVRGRFITQAKA